MQNLHFHMKTLNSNLHWVKVIFNFYFFLSKTSTKFMSTSFVNYSLASDLQETKLSVLKLVTEGLIIQIAMCSFQSILTRTQSLKLVSIKFLKSQSTCNFCFAFCSCKILTLHCRLVLVQNSRHNWCSCSPYPRLQGWANLIYFYYGCKNFIFFLGWT